MKVRCNSLCREPRLRGAAASRCRRRRRHAFRAACTQQGKRLTHGLPELLCAPSCFRTSFLLVRKVVRVRGRVQPARVAPWAPPGPTRGGTRAHPGCTRGGAWDPPGCHGQTVCLAWAAIGPAPVLCYWSLKFLYSSSPSTQPPFQCFVDGLHLWMHESSECMSQADTVLHANSPPALSLAQVHFTCLQLASAFTC